MDGSWIVPTLDNISIIALGLLIYLLFIWITVTLLWISSIKDLTPSALYYRNLNISFMFPPIKTRDYVLDNMYLNFFKTFYKSYIRVVIK
jgi:hypothetical protein